MPPIIDLISWILPILAVIIVLVFVHEWGHFQVARLFGLRVRVFSIGFGPKLWSRTDRKGTEWRLSSIPLGGFVAIAGQDAREARKLSSKNPESRSELFHFAPLRVRTAVVAAGPIANLLFAFLIFSLLFTLNGRSVQEPLLGTPLAGSPADLAGIEAGDRVVQAGGKRVRSFSDWFTEGQLVARGESLDLTIARGDRERELSLTPNLELGAQSTYVREYGLEPFYEAEVGGIVPDSAADEAGLKTGDRLLAVNGRSLTDFAELATWVRQNGESEIRLRVERIGDEHPNLFDLSLTPRPMEPGGRPILGISPPPLKSVQESLSLPSAAAEGARQTWSVFSLQFKLLGQIVTFSRSTKELGGLPTLTTYSREAAMAGVQPMLVLLAYISVMLAVVNLLPIPMLDGGHLLFFAIEALRGRPLPAHWHERISVVAFVLLIALTLFVNWQDLLRWI